MSERYYRCLIVASVLVGVAGAVADLLFPALLPQSFHEVQRIHDEAFPTLQLVTVLLFGVVAVALYLASIYGLYRFRSWAPRLSIIATAVLVVVCALTGAWTQSGVAVSVSYLASYLWGAVLILPFTQPLRARFANRDA